jgi:enoyl-CoA hydratase/carnithine racemase
MTDHIRVTKAGGVLTLTLDRPDKKNALTDTMYAALADALDAAEHVDAVRAILIRGEGDMFTAGNDLGEFAAVAAGGGVPRNVVRFLNALASATKPLVAVVQGRAVGVGMTMLLHADHVVLAEDAVLSAPFVNLALVPEAASSLLLPARIGHVRAFAVMALGETVGAADAVAWGLANRVVPVAELDAAALAVATRLTRLPPGAVRASKTLMRATEAIVGQMAVEMQEFGARLTSPEAQEAFRAFAERRAPDFGTPD